MLDRMARNLGIRYWARAVDHVHRRRLPRIEDDVAAARDLSVHVQRFLAVADVRLSERQIETQGNAGTWEWRPDIWSRRITPGHWSPATERTQLTSNTALYLDGLADRVAEDGAPGDLSAVQLLARQIPAHGPETAAVFGLAIDAYRLSGQYFSVILDLPKPGVDMLRQEDLLRLDYRIESEAPIKIFARLNIRRGQAIDQIPRALPPGEPVAHVEFDPVAEVRGQTGQTRVDTAWLDLIFELPQWNAIAIKDLKLSGKQRAAL